MAITSKASSVCGSHHKLRLLAGLIVAFALFSRLHFVFALAQNTAITDQDFIAATKHFKAGQYQLAERDLNKLHLRFPDDFEVSELLGQVYAAMGDDKKANPLLRRAVMLRPGTATAHLQLGENLFRLRQNSEAESEFRKAVELDPESFEANRDLGEFYVAAGKLPASIPFLKSACHINPSSYTLGHDLALAYFDTQNLLSARNEVHKILKIKNTAEAHNLLAQIEEKSGHYTEAADEYQQAARMEPSESYIFDWGYELLLHRTFEPASSVFAQGASLHPKSVKLQIGLGIALYSLGRYDEAMKAFCRAVDVSPQDPRPYIYLGRALTAPSAYLDQAVDRLRSFVKLEPNNALAYYYFALSLLAQSRYQGSHPDYEQIETLLAKAITLAPGLFDAHLQLASALTEQHKYAEAVKEYQRAISIQPDTPEPHYRLGQVYVRIGEKALGEQELQLYRKLQKQQEVKSKEQARENPEFTFTLK